MFLRALIAFLVLPGMVAYIIPATLLGDAHLTRPEHWFGLPGLIVGTIGLLWCVRDFYVAGKGTLAPWSPPPRLVVVGLYRYSRNPMYVSVVLVLLGWSVAYGSTALYFYTCLVAIAFHLRVVFGEEPWLARVHGSEWEQYAKRVPRWIFTLDSFWA